MTKLTKKYDFIKRYNELVNEDVEYIFIDIKKKRLPVIKTSIVRKENFEAKLKEMTYMYDDNMNLKILDKYRSTINEEEPVLKVVGIYSENYFNYKN